jgi:uncharacterized phage-associated protein
MQIPLVKLKAILRYFCSNTNPQVLGKTKLMKLFYFADFMFIKKYGVPITYDRYIHLEHGPIPSEILNLVNGVIDDGEGAILADTICIKKYNESSLQRIKCLNEFTEKDEKYFSEKELEVLKYTCERFKDQGSKYLEDLSHKEAPWLKTKELEEISYTLAAGDLDCSVDKEDIRLLSQL